MDNNVAGQIRPLTRIGSGEAKSEKLAPLEGVEKAEKVVERLEAAVADLATVLIGGGEASNGRGLTPPSRGGMIGSIEASAESITKRAANALEAIARIKERI